MPKKALCSPRKNWKRMLERGIYLKHAAYPVDNLNQPETEEIGLMDNRFYAGRSFEY